MKVKRFLSLIFIFIIVGLICILFLLYGPFSIFRDWIITTAMSTMNHQYLATWLYSDETINDCLNRNKIIEIKGETDTSLINFINYSNVQVTYKNEYERQILEKKVENNDYKIIKIEGKKYTGYIVAIYDPSRITVAASKYLGESGQYLTTISEQNSSFIGINAGGFKDAVGDGNGGIANGITISKSKFLTTYPIDGTEYVKYSMIGFNKENKLLIEKYSEEQCKRAGIRDAVTFGPVLIKNGELSEIKGNGGGGYAPRSAIGQRKDGIVLFLVLDGDRTQFRGATYQDVQEVMNRYGAINASCLDGGTSTCLTVRK